MRYFLAFFIIINISIFPQNVWKNLASYYDVNYTDVSQNRVFAATTGGYFSFNFSDSSYFTATKSEGLSSQALTALANDENNNVWLGSSEGFINVLLNGNTENIYKIYDIYNSNNEFKSINRISVSGDTVIVSVEFGLSLISSSSFNFIESAMKLGDFTSKSNIINAKKIDGKIYACTMEGLAVEKDNVITIALPESWQSFSFSNLRANYPTAVEKFNDTVFVASDKGLYFIYDDSLYSTSYGSYVNDLISAENDLWLLGKSKLIKYNNGSFETVYSSSAEFRTIKYANSKFYISTNEGVIQLNSFGEYERTIAPNSPPKNLFSSLGVDDNGTLWVASGNDPTGVGIFEYQNEQWSVYDKTTDSELRSNFFYQVYIDGNVKYFSNWGKGFAVRKNGAFKAFGPQETGMQGIPINPDYLVVSGIRKDNKGNLWVLNRWSVNSKPISVMTPDSQWIHFSQRAYTSSSDDKYSQLVIDQYGTKWFANVNAHKGVLYFNDNGTLENEADDEWGLITDKDGLSSSSVNALAIDKYGEVWIGTGNGLDIIPNPSNPDRILEVIAMRSKNITAIYVDPLNNKWIGTSDGVYYLSADGYTVFAQYSKDNSPLPSGKINDITMNRNDGGVYFATDYGITVLHTAAVEPAKKFEELFVYPNPFYVSRNETLTIEGLIENSQIKIFTIDGKLVAASEYGNVSSPGGRIALWNGYDINGEKVGTGIYIVVAYNEEGGESASTKLAVIKE